MSEVLAIIVLFVLIFGGAFGSVIKALFDYKQKRYLPKKLRFYLRGECQK